MRVSSTTSVASAPAMALGRIGGEVDQRRQRVPLRLPAADRALVFLRHGREHRRHQPGRLHRRRHGRAPTATGFCLCGIDDEPPRPAPAPRRPRRLRSAPGARFPATLPSAPHVKPSAHATSTSRPRSVCHGRSGTRRSRRRASASATAGPAGPEARQRAGGAAELHGQRVVERDRQPLAGPGQTVEPRRRLGAEGGGRGLLQPRPAGDRRGDMTRAPGRPRRRGAGRARPAPRRSPRAVAARAPCRSRPGWWRPSARGRPPSRRPPRPARVRCRTSGMSRLPASSASAASAAEVEASARAAARIGATLDAGITPPSASASASATSTSSIAWTRRVGVKGDGDGAVMGGRRASGPGQTSKNTVSRSPCTTMSR